MKKIIAFLIVILISGHILAQSQKEETIKVSGNCNTCKKKIEKAAIAAGASYASWDKNTKILALKLDDVKTSDRKIQERIAAAGYDTPDIKASEEAYKKLDDCCQYDRSASKKQ